MTANAPMAASTEQGRDALRGCSVERPGMRSGNNLYNTLGNLLLNRAAGLLFIDTDSRDVLQLEASTDILTGSHPFAGPEPTGRVVRFTVQRARLFPAASPLHFSWGTTDAVR